jgi:N-methylhydantoinase A
VTDANLLLGRLDRDHFLGGIYRLDAQAAGDGFADFLHRYPRNIKTPPDLARGIVAVANANMERALRVISVERGHDPRDFALICFGGAGGLHAADLARSLGIPQVIVPPSPGAFSALGILVSDIVKDASRSLLAPVPKVDRRSLHHFAEFVRHLGEHFAELEREAREELRREHFSPELARVERRLDVRYVGQAYELPVPFTPDFSKQFHREHEKAYGYAHAGRPIEVVNLRVRLTIPTAKPTALARWMGSPGKTSRALVKEKPVWLGSRFWATPLYDRQGLAPGARLRGPAVVVEYSSTTVVPPDFVLNVDRFSNLLLSPHAR